MQRSGSFLRRTIVREDLDRRLSEASWLTGALLLVAACSSPNSGNQRPAYLDPLPRVDAPSRVVAAGSWDTAYVIGGQAEDTLLLMPRTLAAGQGWVAAFDYGDNQVKRFDNVGNLVWTAGGTGGGPGEFRGNFGLQIDRRGLVWAADPDLARLTALNDTGGVDRMVPLSIERLAAVALVGDRPLAVSSSPSSTLLRIDLSGQVIERRPAPIPSLAELPDFARSVIVASDGGPLWALAYPYGNIVVVYEGLEVRCMTKLVTGQPFPRQPEREPVFSVSAIALQDSLVVVLANGGGEGRNRHLDRYAISDCRYVDSLELPGRFSAMGYDGRRFVLESHDPAPALTALEWRPAPSEAID